MEGHTTYSYARKWNKRLHLYREAVDNSKVKNALVNLCINVTDCATCILLYIYIYICVCVCVTSACKTSPAYAGYIHTTDAQNLLLHVSAHYGCYPQTAFAR